MNLDAVNLDALLTCKTDFWYIFLLFRRKSRRQFTATALAIGRDLRSSERELITINNLSVYYL